MTLHDEIVLILRDKGNKMSTSEIAHEVNRRCNYNKRDGSIVTPFQIHGRTRKYSSIFTREGSIVGLLEWSISKEDININTITSNINYTNDCAISISLTDDVGKISFLNNAGFISLGNIEDILNNDLSRLEFLKNCGVYAISAPANYKVSFINTKSALKKGNVINPWTFDKLNDKWVFGAEILYYGLAGRSSERFLYNRLKDLFNHLNGRTTESGPHSGGEILWQLKDYQCFSIWVFPTLGPPVPFNTESSLLDCFYKRYGKLPFGNRRR